MFSTKSVTRRQNFDFSQLIWHLGRKIDLGHPILNILKLKYCRKIVVAHVKWCFFQGITGQLQDFRDTVNWNDFELKSKLWGANSIGIEKKLGGIYMHILRKGTFGHNQPSLQWIIGKTVTLNFVRSNIFIWFVDNLASEFKLAGEVVFVNIMMLTITTSPANLNSLARLSTNQIKIFDLTKFRVTVFPMIHGEIWEKN